MTYNFIRDAKSVSNSTLCRYDSINGYFTDFSNNGNVDGWDIYNNIYMYGCWNNILFGSAYLPECYIGRTDVFLSVNAEEYFFIEFILKVVDENPNKVVKGLKKGKIMWQRTDDATWTVDRTIEFDITGIGTWEYYKLNLGPYKWWQGDINNLRFYPFIDGHTGDRFFLKTLKIVSEDFWMCSNTSCSFYQFYSHPCQGAGKKASCESSPVGPLFTIGNNSDSELLINIDSYGLERIELGTHTNITGNDLAKVIGSRISSINIGGYSFVEVFYTENNTFKIYSGTNRDDSSVNIAYSLVSVVLGFYNNKQESTFVLDTGLDPASGFDYASTRLLQTFEINALLNGSNDVAYLHNPSQYSVEGGRRDFNEIGTSKLISELEDVTGYISFNNVGKTIIELAKRIDNNGKLTHFWVYGKLYSGASFKILRPHNDGSFTVVHTIPLPMEDPTKLYTVNPIVSRVECDILVNKGDVLGVYNTDIYVGQTSTDLPDATFMQFDGDIYGRVPPNTSYSYGVGGFALYAKGDLKQNNTILDIDLGYRLNVSEFIVSGEELEGYYEFNLASCLDVTWSVDLFGETHNHTGIYLGTGQTWTDTHLNIHYGKSCLDDMIITADNGKAGDVYSQDNGLATSGDHAYFYVNGDNEWNYSLECTGKTEYCGYKWPQGTSYNFTTDPISFTLNFPAEHDFFVHKSIIYFKEEKNFKNIALSTYGGAYYYAGNSDIMTNTLVPEYKYIYLNGVRYAFGDNDNVDKYLFKNPASNDLNSSDYDDYEKTADHIATYFVDWVILGHEFEPIKCKGFRIFCNKHYSTKITEMEVYSRIDNDVSMVDNTILHFSDYGDKWRTTGFKKRDDHTTYAFIGGTPRYFRVAFESQTQFNMREISVTTTEQAYIEESIVLLEDARQGRVGDSKEIQIKNTYNNAFDLTIDIPRDLVSADNIIFWSTLSSSESLSNPEYGPASILCKSLDYPITYSRGQCSNDCFSYGLSNLADGKDAYYCYNNYDWFKFGTVSSGVPIEFNNEKYLARYKFSGSIDPVSSKFWRFSLINSDRVLVLNDILVFYQNNRVDISKILLKDTIPTNGLNYIISNGSYLPYYTFFKDSFSLGTFEEFTFFGSKYPNVSVISNNYLYINGRGGDINLSTYTFNGCDNFEFNFYYNIPITGTIVAGSSCKFEFHSVTHKVFYLVWNTTNAVSSDSCASSNHSFKIFMNDVEFFSSTALGCYLNTNQINKILLRKSDRYVSLYLGDHVFITTFLYDDFDKITSFYFRTSSSIPYVNIYRIDFVYKVLLGKYSWLGIELHDNVPLDNFLFISTGNSLTVDVLSGYNNTNYSVNNSTSLIKTTLYTSFVLDLVKRHSLSIVRNYGTGNLFDISLFIDTLFSNTAGQIQDAVFNSSFDDCRWLNIRILCSDNLLRSLEKLGVYSNIEDTYCKDTGYNNIWVPLEHNLSTYSPIVNVVLNSTISGTTHYKDNIPEFATNGTSNVFETSACWAFEKGTNPKIYIEFGDEYNIGSLVVHHGYSPLIPKGYLKSYKFSLDNTATGDSRNWVTKAQTSLISSSATIKHSFNYFFARRALFEVLDFDTVSVASNEFNSTYLDVLLGYIREIEIFSKEPVPFISSEDFPIICLDLRDKFQVVDVKLYNSINQGSVYLDNINNNYWDNSSEFISYSDSITTDPNKATFTKGQEYTTEYENFIDTGDLKYTSEYLLVTGLYIDSGHHYLDWDAYYPTTVGGISIDIEGEIVVNLYADNYGNGWIKQESEFFLSRSGYFNIYVRQKIDPEVSWGCRNLIIYRLYNLTKWVAIVRDTATNYSYDFTEGKFGPDYLDRVEVYGSEKYVPTEYYWWWKSDLSLLSNDYIYTKVGRRSLKIEYPASSLPDTLRIVEADNFGQDLNWSISDSFSFHIFIDNILDIDTTYGQITFGSIRGVTSDFYYWWDIKNLNLVSGWNEVILNFYNFSGIYPINTTGYSVFFKSELDLRNNGCDISTLTIRYRGKGAPFVLFLDGFKIRRNMFERKVKHGKGLCLTYNDYLMVPLSNINLDRGSLEFWVKMGVDTLGRDYFGNIHAATLFTLTSNTNDIISLRIKPGNWFEVFAGNIRKQSLFNITNLPSRTYVRRDSLIHIGLVWSNTGLDSASGSTIQLFINGALTLNSNSTWEVSDTKLAFFKLGGGITQTSQIFDNQSNFVFENIKVYNYCKDGFLINNKNIDSEYLYTPENFIELSEDNTNFYGIGSENLPIIFKQVPSQESVTIYIRTTKNKKLKSTGSNAQIIVDWLTTV